MNRSRKTAGKPRWVRNGVLTNSGANQVYAEFRACLVDKSTPDHVALDGPACLLPRKHTPKLKGGPLPHPADIRAILARAFESLNRARDKKPELRYLRLALRRFLKLGVTLEQAFGLQPLPGRPPYADDRGQQIAVAVLRQYVTQPGTLENAAAIAGKCFGMGKTQAVQLFRSHAWDALQVLKIERLQAHPALLWTPREERRLNRYYGGRRARSGRIPSERAGKPPLIFRV